MREAQLDKVYNGGFKCHSAGPDISLFDMESEWESWSSQRELISTSEITKVHPVTKLWGEAGADTLETFTPNNVWPSQSLVMIESISIV